MSKNIDEIMNEIEDEKFDNEMNQIIENDMDLKFAFNHIDDFIGTDENWNDFNTDQSIN